MASMHISGAAAQDRRVDVLAQLQGRGDATALVWRDRTVTCSALLAAAARWQAALSSCPAGACVALRGPVSPESVALLLAVFAAGGIAAPLPQAGDTEALLELAAADVLVTFDADDGWRLERRAPATPPPLMARLRGAGHPGLLLFSSGSTGRMKAALHDAVLLLEKYRRPSRAHRCIGFLTLDHIGGINTLASALFGSGTLIATPDQTVSGVCGAIARHRATVLPTTPTFLKMLLVADAPRRFDLSSLSLITYGTEQMPQSVLSALRAALPQVKLKQTYGLTEIGILATRSDDAESLFMQVGGPGFETEVRDGVLWIRARSAMLGYLNAPSPFDADGWLCTGDLVECDGDRLRILGRRSEVINVGGEKVFPAEVESVILACDNIAEAAVWGLSSPVTGQVVAAQVRLVADEPAAAVEARVRARCQAALADWKVPLVVKVAGRDLHGPRFKTLRRAP